MNVLEILTGLLPGSSPGASDSSSVPGAAPASEAAFGTVLAASMGADAGAPSDVNGATGSDSDVDSTVAPNVPLSDLQQQGSHPKAGTESGRTSDAESAVPIDELDLRELDDSATDSSLLLVMPSLAAALSQPVIKIVENLSLSGEAVDVELIAEASSVSTEKTKAPPTIRTDQGRVAAIAQTPAVSESTANGATSENAESARSEKGLAATDSAAGLLQNPAPAVTTPASAQAPHSLVQAAEGGVPVAAGSAVTVRQTHQAPLISRFHSRRHAALSTQVHESVVPAERAVNVASGGDLTPTTEDTEGAHSTASAASVVASESTLDEAGVTLPQQIADARVTDAASRQPSVVPDDAARATQSTVQPETTTGVTNQVAETTKVIPPVAEILPPKSPAATVAAVAATVPEAVVTRQADVRPATESKPAARRMRVDPEEVLLAPAGLREWVAGRGITGVGALSFPNSLGSQPGFIAIDQREVSRPSVRGDISLRHLMLEDSVSSLQTIDFTRDVNARELDLTALDRETTVELSRGTHESTLIAQISPASQSVTGAESSVVSQAQPSVAPPINFSEQLLQAVGTAARDESTLRIQLAPPELGALQVDVQQQAGEMTARLEVQSRHTHQLVVDTLPLLRESLAERGVQIDRVDVVLNEQLSHQSGGFGHGQQQRPETPVDEQALQRLGRGNRARSTNATTTASTSSATPVRRNTLLRDLDIRI